MTEPKLSSPPTSALHASIEQLIGEYEVLAVRLQLRMGQLDLEILQHQESYSPENFQDILYEDRIDHISAANGFFHKQNTVASHLEATTLFLEKLYAALAQEEVGHTEH